MSFALSRGSESRKSSLPKSRKKNTANNTMYDFIPTSTGVTLASNRGSIGPSTVGTARTTASKQSKALMNYSSKRFNLVNNQLALPKNEFGLL
jgi:hypothetical protein